MGLEGRPRGRRPRLTGPGVPFTDDSSTIYLYALHVFGDLREPSEPGTRRGPSTNRREGPTVACYHEEADDLSSEGAGERR